MSKRILFTINTPVVDFLLFKNFISYIYRTLAAGCGNLCGSHLGVQLSNKTMASSMQGALLPGYMDTISDVLSKKILHDEGISFVYVAAVITGIGTVVAAPVAMQFI